MATDGQTPPSDISRASEAVPPAAPNEIDSLVDAIITGASPGSQTRDDRQSNRSFVGLKNRFRLGGRPSPVLFRWAAAIVVAFAVGVLSAAWSLRTFESSRNTAAPQTKVADSEAALRARKSAPNAVATVPPSTTPSTPSSSLKPEVAPSASVPLLPVEATRSARRVAPGSLPAPRIREAVRGPVPVPSPRTDSASRVTDRPAIPSAAATAPAILESAKPPDLPAVALAPVAPPPIAAPSLRGDAAEHRPESGPAAGEREVEAVLDILHDYKAAYENLDVTAAAEVFPSVDRRALSRAFALLKSQEVAFDPCRIDVTGSSAVARCPGVARYVRRIGIQNPLERRYEWVFDMQKKGNDWRIASVTASQGR
jgi:hypothetical protein